MNATAVATRAPNASRKPKTNKAVKPIVTEAQQLHAKYLAVGIEVQDILLNAVSAESDDAVYRFTRLAAQTLAALETFTVSASDSLEWATDELAMVVCDSIALIDVACDCSGDSIGAERIAMYGKARAMLCGLLAGTEYTAPSRKPVVQHIQAAYTRPVQTFCPDIGKTADERLRTLRATLHTADEKLEAAYDAVERGTVVDTLLHLVAHDLLCDVMRPEIMGAEAAPPTNRADLDEAYLALFPVLASLEGAMALSMGTVVHSTIADAYNLLDWAHNECDSAALGKLLPEFDRSAAFNRGRDLAIELLKEGHRQYTLDTANAQRTYRPADANGGAVKQHNFVQQYLDKVEEDSTLSFGFSSVLAAALSEQPTDDPEAYRVPLAEVEAGKAGDDGTEANPIDDATDDAPEVAPVATAKQQRPDWAKLDAIDGDLNNAEIMNDMINDACQFSYDDADECELAQGRIILLSRAVDGYILKARTELQHAVVVAQKAVRNHE